MTIKTTIIALNQTPVRVQGRRGRQRNMSNHRSHGLCCYSPDTAFVRILATFNLKSGEIQTNLVFIEIAARSK